MRPRQILLATMLAGATGAPIAKVVDWLEKVTDEQYGAKPGAR